MLDERTSRSCQSWEGQRRWDRETGVRIGGMGTKGRTGLRRDGEMGEIHGKKPHGRGRELECRRWLKQDCSLMSRWKMRGLTRHGVCISQRGAHTATPLITHAGQVLGCGRQPPRSSCTATHAARLAGCQSSSSPTSEPAWGGREGRAEARGDKRKRGRAERDEER